MGKITVVYGYNELIPSKKDFAVVGVATSQEGIEQIRRESPYKFHVEAEVPANRFADIAPRAIDCRGSNHD